MILRFDFSLIIVSLGDPAVADFSKHYVEIQLTSLTMLGGLLASISLLDDTLLLVAPESRCTGTGCWVCSSVSVEVYCSPCMIPRITHDIVSRDSTERSCCSAATR